ncbi:vacuolar transporter chaperone complex subunit 2 [[Candida] anglica]|uniref:Vacuolar transporter chaperone complex subunit 2 n=1 Tax=[Candida] anglica TaxID=148631 RepID=A0ABP0E960_9ASCO
MLFGNKLDNEVYAPWKEFYMNYTSLKKLLKEGVILKNNWTEKDESNFVTALDSDLEKVYTFQSNKYDELNETLETLQSQTENASSGFDEVKFSTKLEETLTLAQELEHFQRLNYTGFTKIVKKHDRIHPEFSVKPLLNVRLKNLPYHNEDYSPLLYKISALFQFLRDNYNVDQSLSKLSSFHEDQSHQEFDSFKFWIHKDNLMEVKTNILRHLPVLVFNSHRPQSFDDLMHDDSDDENEDDNPTINCLYFDSPSFELYNDKLVKNANSSSLRIKWVGKLSDKPKISIEKKIFDQTSQDFNVGEKLTLKEKYLDAFAKGTFDPTKFVNKMIKRGSSQADITKFADDVTNLESFIKEHNLQPCVRTTYKRTAFQIPGDDKVRIVIDSDLKFIREDAFDSERPIRDPSKWHRTDIDSNVGNVDAFLRKGEFSKFPYSVMEIKVKKQKLTQSKRSQWINDLVSSHLVKEIPNFSKFIQGIASLFLEDDKLDNIPLWFHDLEGDIKVDPEQAYIDQKNKAVKQQNDQENLKKFKSMLSNSASSSGNFSPRSKSFSGSVLLDPPSPSTKGKAFILDEVTEEDSGVKPVKAVQDEDDDDDDDDDDDEDDEEEARNSLTTSSFLNKVSGSGATFAKLIDADSEDEEIELPKGVSKPESYIKNAGPLKIEAKVWLANERTFNRWLHVTTLFSSLTFVVYSSAAKSNSFQVAEILAYFYFALTLFSGVWGYYIFNKRRDIIIERSEKHLDNIIGPLIVAVGLIIALVVNFVFGFKHVAQQQNMNLMVAGLDDTYYQDHPFHKSVHEFVFSLVA